MKMYEKKGWKEMDGQIKIVKDRRGLNITCCVYIG